MASEFIITFENDIITIDLPSRLDATNTEGLQNDLKQFIGKKVEKLVFIATNLEYISSAGLRVIIFAKQKIGVDAHIFLIGASDAILNVIKMSGLDNFMTIQDNI